MRDDYPEFQRRDTEIIAISPDSARKVSSHWEDERIPFPGVPDPDKQLLDQLGQESRWLKFGRLPGVVIVGADGKIHYAYYGDSARDIPETAELLGLLERLPPPPAEQD